MNFQIYYFTKKTRKEINPFFKLKSQIRVIYSYSWTEKWVLVDERYH